MKDHRFVKKFGDRVLERDAIPMVIGPEPDQSCMKKSRGLRMNGL